LHIIQGKHFGGAEQVVLTLASCFDRKRVHPAVLCLSRGLLFEKAKAAGIPVYLIPMRSQRDILVPLVKTIKLTQRLDIDIIHTHTVRSNLIGRLAALMTRRKCVTHLHSPILRDFADFRRGKINEWVDSITRPIATRYIAVSHSLRKEMIQRGLAAQKICTVHNALNLESLHGPVAPDIRNNGIREEFKIPNHHAIVVLVALLRPRKGVEVLITAMKRVLEQITDVHLLIVGNDNISEDPDYGNRLRKLTRRLGIESNIIFTGFRDDVPVILRQADLMVLPSLFGEGLPMVILESMALGVPVVASKVEGVPEVIVDGVNGFLVTPGDSKELSKQIIAVLQNPALQKNTAIEARNHITQNMNGCAQAQTIERIYREVVAC
jgi:glycosyltransferase involved in cell wall biosynthesis